MSVSKDLLRPEETNFIDGYCIEIIEQRQKDEYDPAHGKLHLRNVALLTDAWGIVYRLDQKQRLVIRVGGFLHDIERSPSEVKDIALKNEQFSAEFVNQQLIKLNGGQFPTTDTERRAVKFAVEKHSTSPWVEFPDRLNIYPPSLHEKFRVVLYLSDKMEQIDRVPAVLRRAMFVSGKRLEAGDLKATNLSFDSKEDRLKTFLAESVIRTTYINPEGSFPDRIQGVIRPLYKAQKEFIHATSKSLGINSSGALAKLLLEIQDRKGNNLLDMRGILYQDESELAKVIEEKGGLTTAGISEASADSTESAAETILYLSSKWKERDLRGVVEDWQPNGNLAIALKFQFGEYVGGKWTTDMQQRIMQAA